MKLQTMTKKQQELFFLEDEIVFVSCGAGSGRTVGAAFLAMKDGNNILTVENNVRYSQAGGAKETWKEVLCGLGCEYVESMQRFVKPNGQTIQVMFDTDIVPQGEQKHADRVIIDNFNQLRKDVLSRISFSQLYLMTTPTEEENHPAYKFAKSLFKGKKYCTIVNGFPFFANNLHSLIDVFGEDIKWYEPKVSKASVNDNPCLLEIDKTYLQMLQSLPKNQRERFLEGKWVFE